MLVVSDASEFKILKCILYFLFWRHTANRCLCTCLHTEFNCLPWSFLLSLRLSLFFLHLKSILRESHTSAKKRENFFLRCISTWKILNCNLLVLHGVAKTSYWILFIIFSTNLESRKSRKSTIFNWKDNCINENIIPWNLCELKISQPEILLQNNIIKIINYYKRLKKI